MDTLETLSRRMATAESLRDLVRTMKTLAAVNIRHYEQALRALAAYDEAVTLGLRAVLREGRLPAEARRGVDGRCGVVLFGSDHGLCGSFNEQVVRRLQQDLQAGEIAQDGLLVAVVGGRAADLAGQVGLEPAVALAGPAVTATIPLPVDDLLLLVEDWRATGELGQVLLYHHRPHGPAATRPHRERLLPLAWERIAELRAEPWATRQVPRRTVPRGQLLGALARQSMVVSLHRALVWSATSEHTSRLLAMQAAERNIDERLEALRAAYHTRRQTEITSEVLDIIAGAEAVAPASASRSPAGMGRTATG